MKPVRDFPIVGVGASAGGVAALDGFFRGFPEKPGLAFVVVTHLSPSRESLLHEVVARYTCLPVEIAADGKTVAVNSVYVMPANAIVRIEDGVLMLETLADGHRPHKPIDIFFSSLAEDHGELSVGVVLSGGDADGTLGIKAIKEHGGLTLAQLPDGFGPQHPDMPESAISTGLVDLALPVHEMGSKLVEFAQGVHLFQAGGTGDEATGTALAEAAPAIYDLLRNQIGHDFSGYKNKTFMRRVQRRMQVLQVKTPNEYVDTLHRDAREVTALFRDLLINVTTFFRDADAFENLATQVIPKLFKGKGADAAVRAWVPGCATGEEVYSLAMLMCEHMATLRAVPRVQIFATDIDERALAVARTARYPEQLLEGVSPERRERFFIPDAGAFVVAKEVRDLCIFSPHSVIRDPPFSRMDLISCRNLLIYFGRDVQRQVIPIFHQALSPDGFLFLGTSENVSEFADLFTPVERKHRIFQRRSDMTARTRLAPRMPGIRFGGFGSSFSFTPARPPLGGAALRQMVDAHVLDRFSPPHVVVNRDGEVVYYSARTGKYLEAAPGMPSRQVLTMARKGLRLDLRAIFREAVETGRTATRDSIAVESDDGRVQMINLTVDPLTDHDGGDPRYLILFTDQGPVISREEALAKAHAVPAGSAQQSERELRDTREHLQSMSEEYETAIDELKSSNEELVSVNEELQSTNEELEASKEELVSLNEELHTVNLELSGKVDELDQANSDLQNLFESTAVATVFLDRDLAIRSYTPAMAEVFNILPADRGRPITDLASPLRLPELKSDIQRVFDEQVVVERRIATEDGTEHYLVRVAPYRNGSQRTEGVVISFVNVTSLTQAEARQQVLISELQHRTRNLLAVVQSIAMQTLGRSDAVDAFGDRLAALGRLQGIVGMTAQGEVDLQEIVQMEIDAIGVKREQKITISGPSVPLRLEAAQAFALALHELATNALKYGALKVEAGHLDIAWRIEGRGRDRRLTLNWNESGLPQPPETTRSGYGRQLIEKALTFTLKARTQLRFEADGVRCRIEMPLELPPAVVQQRKEA